ncbi:MULTISPECIES: hypothetical protein [Elizabethkingia]|nr:MULTISPECIES: hypothetical protein [Elizabethkingia]MCT3669877.1 hypothetical protein [Elizabethkingia anophelis]MCT3689720.1 hypothetical protein [Elizabethkingia anophelis]MCT3706192.1 hypothetical protein [Elizabethkingia anophelis]MCT3713210.1 hypothetical protein [Elizabethkingia anophelis]MCT3716628.1 hypothetical protein [Elizabethkingia anophelis]
MIVKDIWTDMDFEQMGWHDNYIHAILFPNENQKLVLDIDYIFKWVLNETSTLYDFWVSPSNLIFMDVLNLKINLDFQNTVGLGIQDINRSNPRPYPNGKGLKWDYSIFTDNGSIVFESSGFVQNIKKQPILTNSTTLIREY